MDQISRELGINPKQINSTASDSIHSVVVHTTWLKKWLKSVENNNFSNNIEFSLRPGESVYYPWKRVFIKVLNKKVSKVLPLPRYKFGENNSDTTLSISQILQYVSHSNQRSLWKESYKKYCQNVEGSKESTIVNLLEHDQLVSEVVLRLYGCNLIRIKTDSAGNHIEYKEITNRNILKAYETHTNLLAALFALETDNNIFVVYRGHYENTLSDCLNFSPNLIDLNYGRGLFIVYQLLHMSKALSDRGLSMGMLTLQDIFLSEDLWLQVMPLIMNNIHCLDASLIYEQNRSKQSPAKSSLGSKDQGKKEDWWRNDAVQLEKLCLLWVRGRISNLDYIIHLNVLAGRSANDPQANFMVPWVTDFSSRCGRNWRDLSRSKYRLNKGDRQLDMTYDVSAPDQIPHHVSDALSDITCYVYLARRTAKEVLCKYVRNNWVPAEYPASIQRMQEWTPDECIPEFYTDPTVFKSIHEDLPDLGIPTWATCAEDFITKHRESLESAHVSENLHHWIDITFGYKLSGAASIKAKNVCLSLVDGHTSTRRGGMVQLLTAPHPPKASKPLPPAPPRLHWTTNRESRKSIKNDSSDDISDDEDESVSQHLPQHVSRLHVPPQRIRSRHSSSRARSLSKSIDDSQHTSSHEGRASSHSRHYRVQRSELGKGIIYLPKEFNPVSSIQALESLDNFRTKCFFSKAQEREKLKENATTLNLFPMQQELKQETTTSKVDDDTAFTNHIFLASYEQSYFKKMSQEAHIESVLKERKNRSFNTRYTTDAAVYKQFVTESRRQDMLVIGCLIVEIFLHTHMRPLRSTNSSFVDRFNTCRVVLKHNFHAMPKCVSYLASLLLNVPHPNASFRELTPKKEDPMKKMVVTDKGLPAPSPSQLLQPLLMQHLIPFPQNFTILYNLLSTLHEYELASNELNILYMYECDGTQCEKYQNLDKTKMYFTQKIAEGKIQACIAHLDVLLNQTKASQFDILDIFLAYYIKLLQSKDTSVLAAWYLFDTISKALGPEQTRKKLLKHILNLYEDDDYVTDKTELNKLTEEEVTANGGMPSRQKFVKLYHNIFLLQLMVRLGLQCFLDNFTQHLVEAVGGYKDISSDVGSPGHLCYHRLMANKKPRYSDDNVKNALSTNTDIFSPDTSYGSENVTTPSVDKTMNESLKDTDNRSETELFHFETDKDRLPSRNCRSKSPAESIESYNSSIAPHDNTPSPLAEFPVSKYSSINREPNVVVTKDEDDKKTSPSIEIPTKSMFTSYIHFADDNEDIEVRTIPGRQVNLNLNKSSQETATCNLNDDDSECKENCKISDMSSESLIWLAHRLGPVLTCRYITRNLLKMLTLCYIGKENLCPWETDEKDEFDEISIVNSKVMGDKNAGKVINCLTSIVAMYGEQLIIFQYLPHMSELIASCRKRLSVPLEGGVVACLQLLKHLLPFMTDVNIMEQLQDTFLRSILSGALRLCGSGRACGGGARARAALTRKMAAALHALALRVGPEMTRKHLCVPPLQRFFLVFDKATGKIENWPKHDDNAVDKVSESESADSKTEGFLELCRDGSTCEWCVRDGRVLRADLPDLACSPPGRVADCAALTAQEELLLVFDEELAYQTYTSFSKLIGADAVDRCLKNPDTIKEMCRKYEQNHSISSPMSITKRFQASPSDEPLQHSKPDIVNDHISSSNSFGSNITLVGNRIDVASDAGEPGCQDGFDVVACKVDNAVRTNRHLRGDWLIYWEHEIGRPDKDTRFNLKQIKLQTFLGHTHSVKSIHCLDNESSFMSGSKDKTVKLWSLRNQGDGNATTQCNWTYTGHKKGVLSLSFLESLRLAVSTDSVVHIWDPFMESVVSQLEHIKAPVSIVRPLGDGSAAIVAASGDSIRIIDARAPHHNYELKVPLSASTFIRSMAVTDHGARCVCGLASGHVAVLDLRTGQATHAWKAHDSEVLRVAAVDEKRVLSSGLDQVTALWKQDDGELIAHLKGTTEPVHCLSVYYNELISGTTNNRIGVHTSLGPDASFSSTKLRSDTFKGVLTCMSVLSLNRLLLLGSDNGTISLLC